MKDLSLTRRADKKNHASSSLSVKQSLILLLLGFSSGLPLALVSTTLAAWFALSGASMLQVGSLSLVSVPYVIKFAWAPLFDYFPGKILGRRRDWLLLLQLLLVLIFLLIAWLNPTHYALSLALIALLAAFLSASQDTVLDAYRSEWLLPAQRGMGNAFFVAGYRVAMLVSGGLALIVANYHGWRASYQLMACFMLLGVVATLLAHEQVFKQQQVSNFFGLTRLAIGDFFRQPRIGLIIAFILFYKLGDGFALVMNIPFLLKMGYSMAAIGTYYKSFGLVALLLGTFLGGLWVTRFGLFNSLWLFGILQALANLLFMLVLWHQGSLWFLLLVVAIENLSFSMATVAFLAFLMPLCNRNYTAMQFALLTALVAVARVIAGPLGGGIEQVSNWLVFYVAATLVALPGLYLLLKLKKTIMALEKRPLQKASA